MPVGSRLPAEITSLYSWSPATGRYKDEAGRFVPRTSVRAALDGVVDSVGQDMASITQQLREGRITLAQWQVGMQDRIKTSHLAATASARGGWAQMTRADHGRVGGRVRQQYSYLDGFAQDVASGKQKLDGRLVARAAMYAQASRNLNEQTTRKDMADKGITEERRLLHARESCTDCITYAAMGWQPINSLPSIGDSQCLTNCRCTFDYKDGALVEADALPDEGAIAYAPLDNELPGLTSLERAHYRLYQDAVSKREAKLATTLTPPQRTKAEAELAEYRSKLATLSAKGRGGGVVPPMGDDGVPWS